MQNCISLDDIRDALTPCKNSIRIIQQIFNITGPSISAVFCCSFVFTARSLLMRAVSQCACAVSGLQLETVPKAVSDGGDESVSRVSLH